MLQQQNNNNFLIYSIKYLITIFIFKFFLNLLNIDFLNWFYYLSYNLIYVIGIIGIFQFVFKIKNKKMKIILLIPITLLIILLSFFLLFIQTLSYKPTHIIEKDNIDMVVSVSEWDRLTTLYYYKYYNIFFKSYNYIESETITDLTEDPFKVNSEYKKYLKY